MSGDPVGEVLVRRQGVRSPRELWPWALDAAARLAWSTFEDAGFDADDEFGLGWPPVHLIDVRPTPDPRYWIARFDVNTGVWSPEPGFMVGVGYMG